jgi:hypothetical protein
VPPTRPTTGHGTIDADTEHGDHHVRTTLHGLIGGAIGSQLLHAVGEPMARLIATALLAPLTGVLAGILAGQALHQLRDRRRPDLTAAPPGRGSA